jgi:hypothetical protein
MLDIETIVLIPWGEIRATELRSRENRTVNYKSADFVEHLFHL